jgi:hypothetical protein
MGLCALSHVTKAQALQMTDFLPTEEKVQIAHLSNGVKTYVQEHGSLARSGSFRVVFKKAFSEEELYRYDGSVESLDSLEQFFNYCKEKASVGSIEKLTFLEDANFAGSRLPSVGTFWPQEIAVVAVGDFSTQEMQALIEKYFGSLKLTEEIFTVDDAIQIGADPNLSKVALSLSYPISRPSIQTYSDLKEAWRALLLQDLFQQRLERCSRRFAEIWVHPHPRFFYPVNGYSLVSHNECENLLTFFLWQVEAIRNDGFHEDEFDIAKQKTLDQLQYLASRSILPDDAFLASYFADQFLLGDRCLSLEPFMNASVECIEEMKMQDIFPYVDSFLLEQNRSIQVAYPQSIHAKHLTKEQIEEMIQRVSFLASFYRDGEIPDDAIWTLETQDVSSLPVVLTKAQEKNASSLIKLVNTIEPEPLDPPTDHFVIPMDKMTDETTPFYQLPITEKEKRIIHVIITTMAEKNILQLAFIKRTMEKKGKKIEHVHPLRFMGHVLSKSELRSCLRTIKKSSFKWDAFIDGFSRRMKEEYSNNNLYIHIPGFCHQIGGDQEEVTHFIQKKDWEGLVKEYM